MRIKVWLPVGILLAVLAFLIADHHYIGWPSLPHRYTPAPPTPTRVHYLTAPRGVVELDRSHYWIKNGFAQNAWHLCEQGVKQVDHGHSDDMGNSYPGKFSLSGGAVLVCNAANDHYLFTTPKLGGKHG